jgi:hypothetical protein
MNSIDVIKPYQYLGMWVLDDPQVGLVQEPFVSEADEMIDRIAGEIPDAGRGFGRNWSWKGGYSRRYCGTVTRRRKKSMSR